MNLFSEPRTVLAREATSYGEIQLQQRRLANGRFVYEIIANGVFLMASYNQKSERALAGAALTALGRKPERLLVGGLGMGFTLQETLALGATAVSVVELSPQIIAWNRTYLAALNGNVLADSRVTLIEDDLYNLLMQSRPAGYDAVLLDVDNGPSWLVHPQNARLYSQEALRHWSALLTAGGVLAVWSAQPEPDFLQALTAVFPTAQEQRLLVPTLKDAPTENFIYFGQTKK